jgi:hypothetical protein
MPATDKRSKVGGSLRGRGLKRLVSLETATEEDDTDMTDRRKRKLKEKKRVRDTDQSEGENQDQVLHRDHTTPTTLCSPS